MSDQAPNRPTLAGMRQLLIVAAGLVISVGAILFGPSAQTDRYFAWTIGVPATAAFLGAAYLAAGLGELVAARSKVWAQSRIAAPAVLIFAATTLLVTLIHRDAFHFGSGHGLAARFVAWVWLVIYAAFPVAMTVLLIRQRRAAGADPPRRFRLSNWVKAVLVVQAVLMLAVGVALLLAPAQAAPWWPWPLTALTAQAIGAWGVGLGFGVAQAVWEDDWLRIQAGDPIYLGFGLLGLLALARYPGVVAWGRPAAWILVALLVSFVVGGAYGLAQIGRARTADRTATPANAKGPEPAASDAV